MMMHQFRRWKAHVALGVLSLGTLLGVHTVHAADYPDKSITLIVPFSPGGTTDLVARLTAEELGLRLGQSVVVENRSGAAGNVGTNAFVRAAPDGYTLLMANRSTNTINPALYKNIEWDPIRSFTPLAMIVRVSNVVVVTPSFPADSLRALMQYAQQHPKAVNYGTIGVGDISQVVLTNNDIPMTPVAYRGTSLSLTDVAAGHIQLMFPSIPGALPFVQGGRLKPLAVTGSNRIAQFPDVPTVAEAGYPELNAIHNWFAVFAPAGIPDAVRIRLETTFQAMLQTPTFQDKLKALGAEPGTQIGSAMRDTVVADLDYWKQAVARAGITVEE